MTPEDARSVLRSRGMCGALVGQVDGADRVCILEADHAGPCPAVGQAITCVGNFRVYFNRHQAAPLVWCVALMMPVEGVDRPAWEIAVQHITFDISCVAVYEPKLAPDHEDGMPSAWIAVSGRLTVDEGGHARIGPA